MSFTDVRKRLQEQKTPEPERDPLRCVAHGCPCNGTVDIGNAGRFACSWHAWVQPERWPLITERLCEHRWLLDFIGDMQRMHIAGEKWRDLAEQFFATEQRDLQPTPAERERVSWYVWRLRQHLAWLTGERKDKPQPREMARKVLNAVRDGQHFDTEIIDGALAETGDLARMRADSRFAQLTAGEPA